jgi:uncharacterized protein
MAQLPDSKYLSFPFRFDANSRHPGESSRIDHVRQLIEQVLFTGPYERLFRPEFGAGIGRLVFEPNASALWEVTRKRLASSLMDVLQGEVDPETLRIEVEGKEEMMIILISYVLATVGQQEEYRIPLTGRGRDG